MEQVLHGCARTTEAARRAIPHRDQSKNRRHTRLPLDECLYSLPSSSPHSTRSSPHRCLQRHGISRWQAVEGEKPRKKFKIYPIGHLHIDIADVQPTRAGATCLWRSTEPPSLPTPTRIHEPPARLLGISRLALWKRRLITVKRHVHQTHEQLNAHLQTCLMAYDLARRLKTLKGLTSYEFVCKT